MKEVTTNKLRIGTLRVAMAFVAASLFSLLLGDVFSSQADEEREERNEGAVYVLTNKAEGNTVVAFHRSHDGSLTRIQEASTGGLGSGPGELPPGFPPGPGPNPLDSQDALVLTRDGRFLLAVNSKSNDVSVFSVTERGLRLVDKVPSGGDFPVSIAHHNNLIYVLNEGESPDTFVGAVPNMTGFFLDFEGRLHRIPRSTRITGKPDSGPSQIVFTPDGEKLIITEMFTNLISEFGVSEFGLTTNKITFPANNRTPLAVSFGRHHLVAITEGNDSGHRTGVPNGATLSTYRLTDEDTLEPVSKAAAINKTGSCWVRFSPDGRFAFTGDTGSGTVSSFSVSRGGELTLLGAADTGGVASVPIDLDITPDGKFLYVLASFSGAVEGFRIEKDGSLKLVANAGGLPITIQGIVAR